MEYRIERGELNETAIAHLRPALDGHPYYGMTELAMQLQQGRAALYHIHSNPCHVGTFALAVNALANGREEIEITAGGAATDGPDMTQICVKFARQVAIDAGIDIVRNNTRRQGVGRLLERYGMQLDEYIYRMEIQQ